MLRKTAAIAAMAVLSVAMLLNCGGCTRPTESVAKAGSGDGAISLNGATEEPASSTDQVANSDASAKSQEAPADREKSVKTDFETGGGETSGTPMPLPNAAEESTTAGSEPVVADDEELDIPVKDNEELGDGDDGDDEDVGELPDKIGGALKRDDDGNVIADGPPPVPNDDPSRLYDEVPAEWIKMPGQATWIDKANGRVIIDGVIARKTGLLELLICTGGFKLHESVIAAHTKPSIVMAALLAVGAVPGGPAEFDPKFMPAHGTEIEILVRWREGDEEVEVPAQELIVDQTTQDIAQLPWVLAGSGMWPGNNGGPERFASDHTGDFVCVSNFASCMMDIPAELSDSNEMLTFLPNTELVPPLGTKVRMTFTPKVVRKKKPAAEAQQTAGDQTPAVPATEEVAPSSSEQSGEVDGE